MENASINFEGNSVPFYNCYFTNPLPPANFLKSYNQPHISSTAFYPMTFIDFSNLTDRNEYNKGEGKFINDVEARIIAEIISTLYGIMDEALDNQIAVIAPYKAQVENIITTISHFIPSL